jgi:hypothetical protein
MVEVSKRFGTLFMIIAWPSYYTASCLHRAHISVAKTIRFELSLRLMFCINRTYHSSLHTPPASRTSSSLHERVLVLNFKTAAFSIDILAPNTFLKHLFERLLPIGSPYSAWISACYICKYLHQASWDCCVIHGCKDGAAERTEVMIKNALRILVFSNVEVTFNVLSVCRFTNYVTTSVIGTLVAWRVRCPLIW